jgi:hypothetical protein
VLKEKIITKNNSDTLENIKEGKYIYGIIRSGNSSATPMEYGRIGIGERGDKVYTINYKDIGAVVSNSPVIIYETRRAYMIAHEKVLEEVMKQFTVLPVRFSTISESDDDVKIENILKRDYVKFTDLLEKIEGKKELGLKVLANSEEAVYKHILDKYEDIKTMKEKLRKLPPEKNHYQLMKIGEMVSDALKNEKERMKNAILDALNPLAEDVKINSNYGDMMILNAAFLIKNETEPAFDTAVKELDNKNNGFLRFKYVGTLPPYNFVNLVINIEGD